MTVQERGEYLDRLHAHLASGAITDFGATVKSLRTDVTGLTQEKFARMCRIEVTTLRQLERNQISPTVQLLNRILTLFGFQAGITRVSREGRSHLDRERRIEAIAELRAKEKKND